MLDFQVEAKVANRPKGDIAALIGGPPPSCL